LVYRYPLVGIHRPPKDLKLTPRHTLVDKAQWKFKLCPIWPIYVEASIWLLFIHTVFGLFSLSTRHMLLTHKIEGSKELSAHVLTFKMCYLYEMIFENRSETKEGWNKKKNMKSLWTSRVFGFAFIIPYISLFRWSIPSCSVNGFPMISQWLFSNEFSQVVMCFSIYSQIVPLLVKLSFALIFALRTESWSEFS